MKASRVGVAIATLVSVLLSGFAAAAQPAGKMHPKDLPACQAPFAACKAAGYKVGAHHKGDKEGADMGLWRDCIDAVADGIKQVPGVDQAAAKACKEAKHEMRGH